MVVTGFPGASQACPPGSPQTVHNPWNIGIQRRARLTFNRQTLFFGGEGLKPETKKSVQVGYGAFQTHLTLIHLMR